MYNVILLASVTWKCPRICCTILMLIYGIMKYIPLPPWSSCNNNIQPCVTNMAAWCLPVHQQCNKPYSHSRKPVSLLKSHTYSVTASTLKLQISNYCHVCNSLWTNRILYTVYSNFTSPAPQYQERLLSNWNAWPHQNSHSLGKLFTISYVIFVFFCLMMGKWNGM